MHNVRKFAALIAAATVTFAPSAHAQSFTGVVNGSDNIYGSGHPFNAIPQPGGGYGGTYATTYNFLSGANRVLKFSSVSGSVSPDFDAQHVGPDGGEVLQQYIAGGAETNLQSYNGISGIVNGDKDHAFALVGVFLDGTEPIDPAPARQDITGHEADFSFSPLINQTFFIGDGLTGTGSGATQSFYIPDGATSMELGYADGDYLGDPTQVGAGGSAPGFYGDNGGTINASFSAAPVPEFSSSLSLGAMLALGLGGMAFRSRRKRITE